MLSPKAYSQKDGTGFAYPGDFLMGRIWRNAAGANYWISENVTWSEAVVGAYLSDAPDAETTEEDEGEEEFFD